jgi:hypothetical protein
MVFLLSAALLIVSPSHGPRTEPAQAWIDPWARIPAQDEALYSHAALRMAAGESWLTPHFLGRKLLVKPPLALWVSALSHRLGLGLRTPHILAAAGVATLVYSYAGPVGFLLLASRGYWRERAGLLMMDDLLILLYLMSLALLLRDPRLDRKLSPWLFGALVGLAIMTKWFAGLLPLALLLWTRPPLKRVASVMAALIVVALPWHLYQYIVNGEWFLAEYIGVELLTYATRAPVQSTSESTADFYFARAAWLLPCLLPALWSYWRKRSTPLPALWCALCLAATLAYGYHNASYLLPLAPALLLIPSTWLSWHWLPLAMLFSSGPALAPAAAPGDRLMGREALHLDVSDQFRTSLARGATVRYLLFLDHLPPNGPLDFEARGIAKPVKAFVRSPGPEVDVVLTPNLSSLQELIASSPQRDFILPESVWHSLAKSLAMEVPHGVEPWIESGKVWLKSRSPQAGPRPFQTFAK